MRGRRGRRGRRGIGELRDLRMVMRWEKGCPRMRAGR